MSEYSKKILTKDTNSNFNANSNNNVCIGVNTNTNTRHSNKTTFNFCNNCGKTGHSYQQCKMPITSIGFVAFTKNENSKNEDDRFKFLMIRRKDSLAYVDFLRGRYKINNLEYLQTMINDMTNNEKERLINKDFDELWIGLWGRDLGIHNRSEEKVSREKFNNLKTGTYIDNNFINLNKIINNSDNVWEEPEWGFPKGRRNHSEKDLPCALREFQEETGYLSNDLNLINNILPMEEIFIGSNYKCYKHKYFLAYIDNSKEPDYNYQETEVSKVEWKTIDDVLACIRYYNLEKKDLINKINKILYKYTIYH